MLNNEIAYINGKSSRDFGVYLIDGNIFDFPKRDVEYINVPGRSGSLTIDKGRWENIDITYTFAAYSQDAPTRLNAWKDFVLANVGYLKIETSVEPELYRQGVYKSASSPKVSMIGGGGYMDVTFSCMPQKWLKANAEQDAIALSSDQYMRNPTNFDARPLLRIKASQTGATIIFYNQLYYAPDNDWFDISYSVLHINTTDWITLDCETGDAYSGNTNYNSYVEIDNLYDDDFPVISGQNKYIQHPNLAGIKFVSDDVQTRIQTSNMTSISMNPRWWTL